MRTLFGKARTSASGRTVSCGRCGEALPPGAAFCPACGLRLEPGTDDVELPPDETGPVPVHVMRVSRVPAALTSPARALERAFASARGRAAAGLEALAIRSRAQRQLARLRYEREELGRRRRDVLIALGEAVYAADASGTERALERIHEVDAEIAAKDEEATRIVSEAEQQAEDAQLPARPTQVVEPPPPEPLPVPHVPAEPPRIPEPAPEPHVPPQPPGVPEPSPEPHEPPAPGGHTAGGRD